MDAYQKFMSTSETENSGECREKRLSRDANGARIGVGPAETSGLTNSVIIQSSASQIVLGADCNITGVQDSDDVKCYQEFISIAQTKNNSNNSSESVKNLSQTNMKSKVDSFTQVEANFENELCRNIVGQERLQDIQVAGTSTDPVPRENRKYVRPPLVGQASSSSNESGSVAVGRRRSTSSELDNSYEEHDIPPPPRLLDRYREPCSTDGGTYYTSMSVRNFNLQPSCLTNRDDYINERPPEGSDQYIVSAVPADPPDSQRIPSPSSVSSVNSARPLEWDSGADVGYYQNYVADNQGFDPGLSTIERIALVRGTAVLLTRSDPEGTTGSSGQVAPVQPPNLGIKVKRSKDFIGVPKGESTPVNFLQNKSSSTSAESESEISPIINENNAVKNAVNIPSVSGKQNDNSGFVSKNNVSKESQKKYPLFPEVVRSKLQETKRNICKSNVTGAELCNIDDGVEHPTDTGNVEISGKHNARSENKNEFNGSNLYKNNALFGDNNMVSLVAVKKLSSSLEDIRDVNKLPESNDNMPQISRPRSRSQSNLFTYPPDNVKSDEHFSRSMAFHYPKSGSSSSIATVVQKKRDSPKHLSKLVQTNSLIKHSLGIQASDGDRVQSGTFLSSNAATPHIPSREFKGNFRDMLDKEELNASEAQRRQIESKLFPKNPVSCVQNDLQQDKTLQDNHYHGGIPCSGAHKKTYQISPEAQQQSLPPVRTAILDTAYKKNSLDIKKPEDRCNSTLESLESSAKSHGGYCFERQSSVTVEDRVNSFEYLPGDVYENTAGRRAGTISDVGSSSESARIELNEDKDRLWDSSASSTLVRDVNRGVDIMMDFIKSSHATDMQLKQKLIRRVVQKLINSDYASDRRQEERISLERNIPWVPPVIETNPTSVSRETKLFTRSRVPGECTSSSVGTTTTDHSTSSECFKPVLKKDISVLKTTVTTDKCVGTGCSLVPPTSSSNQNGGSATPYITSDSSGRQYDARQQWSPSKQQHSPSKQPNRVIDSNMNLIRSGRLAGAGTNDTTTTTTNMSDTVHSSSSQADWRQPVTKTEKLYEQRRKLQDKQQDKDPRTDVLRYLDMERENQLFWIRSEIQHLNNLKTLLEKQEELKENIKEMRKSKYRNHASGPEKKENEKHNKRNVTSSGSSANYKESSLGAIASPKKTFTHQGGSSTLRSWLLRQQQQRSESSEESHHNNPNLYQVDSHRQVRKSGKESWTSHENLSRMHVEEAKNNHREHGVGAVTNQATSSLNPKENKSILKSRNPVVGSVVESSEGSRERLYVVQTSPKRSSRTKEEINRTSGKNFYADRVSKETEKNRTESLQRVHNAHEERKGEESKLHKGKQNGGPCERDGYLCKCCKERKLSGEDRTKQPVGYYITFEQSLPRVPKKKQHHQPVSQKERVEIIPPYSEPAAVRQTAVEHEAVQNKKFVSSPRRDQKQIRSSSSDTDSQSKDESDENGSQQTPTLQDYLETNRPDYVSRAEDRRQCVAELVYLRELRDKSKRRLLELTDSGPATRDLPPPPLAVKRVFNQRTMRRQTEKKYKQLSEVQGKQQDMKRKQAYRTNRLMAQVFTKKLQRRVLKGEVNLSNSVSVISNI